MFRLYVLSARRFNLSERSAPALLHVLMNFEHSPAHVADMLRLGVVEYDQTQLVSDIARYGDVLCCAVNANERCSDAGWDVM